MKKKLLKYGLIAIVLGGLAGGAIGAYLFYKPSDQVVRGKADHTLTASQLFAEFTRDEDQANAAYLNKILSVTGQIAEIGEADSLGVTLVLKTDGLFGINCQLPAVEEVNDLHPGDEVTVKGLCTGFLMEVVLIKCTIENDKN